MAQALKDISLRIGQLLIFTVVTGLLLHLPINGIVAAFQDAQTDVLARGALIIFLSILTIAAVNITSDIIFENDSAKIYSKLVMTIIIIMYFFWSILF